MFRLIPALLLLMTAVACGSSQPTTSPLTSRAPTLPPQTVSPTASPAAATPEPTATPVSPSPTPVAATLLLEVRTEGGFIAPSARLGQVPDVVVDTDGNIYTPDFSFATPTMIQKVVVRNVGPNGAARILDAMRAAGLDQPGDDGGVVADTGVTVFTAVIDGQEIVNKIAMSGPGPQPDISPHPGVGLLARLQDPAETWGAADVQPATFTPTAYRIYLADSLADGTGIEWPLATSVDDFGQPSVPNFDVDGLRAGVVFGDDAQKITDAFGDQPEGSYVQGANGLVAIWIRPLLPPEIA